MCLVGGSVLQPDKEMDGLSPWRAGIDGARRELALLVRGGGSTTPRLRVVRCHLVSWDWRNEVVTGVTVLPLLSDLRGLQDLQALRSSSSHVWSSVPVNVMLLMLVFAATEAREGECPFRI